MGRRTYLGPVFLIPLFLRLEPLLVGDKLLLHEQPVLYALQLEQSELALGIGSDARQLGTQA